MKAEELDEQFQAMESDSQVKAAAAGTPPAPPVRRRITTAQVKKELDRITATELPDICNWVGELDSRLDKLESVRPENLTSFVSDTTERIEKIEAGSLSDRADVAADISLRLDAIENATGALAGVMRSIVDDVERLQPAKAEEIEFAKPPEAIHDQPVQTADIAAVASVCLTMNDVLMITRALKDTQDLSEMERVNILNIACRSAGVECTHGMRIRAGIHDTR